LGKISEKVKEVARLRNVLAQSSFSPEQMLNDGHHQFITDAVGDLGLVWSDLNNQLAKQVCDLHGCNEATAEQVYEAVTARLLRLVKDVEKAQARREELKVK
jgi:hypothetical protein